MQILPNLKAFEANTASAALAEVLSRNEDELKLNEAILYHSFPLYRDEEDGVVAADCLLLSQAHGVVAFALAIDSEKLTSKSRQHCQDILDQVPPHVYSRLVKNRRLRQGAVSLAFEISTVVFAPSLKGLFPSDWNVASTGSELSNMLDAIKMPVPLKDDVFKELISTIEGAKGLIRPKKRDLPSDSTSSKGRQAEMLEEAISLFDHQQKRGMIGPIVGPQRIRGLAGSGKTVVLAMKAALIHLNEPDAKIAYTFSTKSLYQHVKRLITRFYRQFDDRDPDWDHRVHVLHGWGGASNPGLYSVACDQHGVEALSYASAGESGTADRFEYACTTLLDSTEIRPIYDYIFVDEGQDFPLSFVRLCHSLAKDGKFVLAYDDLQTIFQVETPSTADIFGTDASGNPNATFVEDIVLHKCYRNPREVLVVAHAVGFGIYGTMVQMIKSREHWEDIGYEVLEGDFTEGSHTVIERPEKNSLPVVSTNCTFDQIVSFEALDGIDEEVGDVVKHIRADLSDGLDPEDILVISADDRLAKRYLSSVEIALGKAKIKANNLHADSWGIRDFAKAGRITLSTVHKAKGNEAFMVYVVGIDALMSRPTVRSRNMLFTALTRAKGWVRITGSGAGSEKFKKELRQAKKHFPKLDFIYPGAGLKVMERDLAELADKKQRLRKAIEEVSGDLSESEAEALWKEVGAEKFPPRRKGGKK